MRQGANITLAALAGATTALNLESGTALAMTLENQLDLEAMGAAGMNALQSMMEKAGPTLGATGPQYKFDFEEGGYISQPGTPGMQWELLKDNQLGDLEWTDAFDQRHSLNLGSEESVTVWSPVVDGTFVWYYGGEKQEQKSLNADQCKWAKLVVEKLSEGVKTTTTCYSFPGVDPLWYEFDFFFEEDVVFGGDFDDRYDLLSRLIDSGVDSTEAILKIIDDIDSQCRDYNKSQHVGLDYQVATNWPEGLEHTVATEGGFGEKNKITTHEFNVPAAVYRFKDYFNQEHTIYYPQNSC